MTTPRSERRALPSAPRSIDEETRTIEYLASNETMDAHGTKVLQDWDLKRFSANPVVLLGHDPDDPIGTAEVRVSNEGLIAVVKFATGDACAERAWNLAKQGVLRGISVGFLPHDRRWEKHDGEDVMVLAQNELFELSLTALPSNPEALAREAQAGRHMPENDKTNQPGAPQGNETMTRAAHVEVVGALQGELKARTVERDAAVQRAEAAEAELTKIREREVEAAVEGYCGRKFTAASKDKWLRVAKTQGRAAFEELMSDLPDIALGGRLVPDAKGEARATDGAGPNMAAFQRAKDKFLAQGMTPAAATEAAAREINSTRKG